MCGIIGYTGYEKAKDILIEGLKRLEYRGYDSSGVSLCHNGEIHTVKTVGNVSVLKEKTASMTEDATCGIGHTRWATHGKVNSKNAHPHISNNGKISVVHNGIIENSQVLKDFLINKGYTFFSDTDSEVIPNLMEYYYSGDLLDALIKASEKLKGSYSICAVSSLSSQEIVCTRYESPLLMGQGERGCFVASDAPAFSEKVGKVYVAEDGEFIRVKKDSVIFYDRQKNIISKNGIVKNDSFTETSKGEFAHYMLKEIMEQPQAILDTLSDRIKMDEKIHFDGLSYEKAKNIGKVCFVACGSAYHAALFGEYITETVCKVDSKADIASEFRYREKPLTKDTLVVGISQSGETADTLAAIRYAKEKGCMTLAVTNVKDSSITKEADGTFYTCAGYEVSVASTKAYMTQLVSMCIFSLYLAQCKAKYDNETMEKYKAELLSLADKVEGVFSLKDRIKTLAEKIAKKDAVFFIGRGTDYISSMESALKLKETSYINAVAYAAGELKHGPIALIDEDVYVIALNTVERLRHKTHSNIMEIVSRGASVIEITTIQEKETDICTICTEGVSEMLSPCVSIVVTQLMAYYVSVKKGLNPDRPRNLAKAVTVE